MCPRWVPGGPAIAVIPALDEEASIGEVIRAIPGDCVREVVVVDNGSRDATARVASEAGATVIHEPRRGYGRACWAAVEYLRATPPEIVAFLDGDGSDHPEELAGIVRPILEGEADLVVGSRRLGHAQPGSLTPAQRFGNALATGLIHLLSGHRFTDLGPFRALTWDALERLDMRDRGYGWTVEMQLKAVRRGLRCQEVPVSYRPRVGRSKISGTVRGAAGAGAKILYTVFREGLRPAPRAPRA